MVIPEKYKDQELKVGQGSLKSGGRFTSIYTNKEILIEDCKNCYLNDFSGTKIKVFHTVKECMDAVAQHNKEVKVRKLLMGYQGPTYIDGGKISSGTVQCFTDVKLNPPVGDPIYGTPNNKGIRGLQKQYRRPTTYITDDLINYTAPLTNYIKYDWDAKKLLRSISFGSNIK